MTINSFLQKNTVEPRKKWAPNEWKPSAYFKLDFQAGGVHRNCIFSFLVLCLFI